MEKIKINTKNMNLTSSTFKEIAKQIKEEEQKEVDRIQKERLQGRIDKLNLSEFFQRMTLDNYIAKTEKQNKTKEKAVNYAENFRNESIIFCGQVGSGKTHLSVAILNYLIHKLVDCRYFDYREETTRLKQIIMTDEYNAKINELLNCELLVIDDLFKGKITDSDKKIIFEIINARYKKAKPVVISTELSMSQLIEIDEAIGSRIYEMCKKNVLNIQGIPNQRLIKEA